MPTPILGVAQAASSQACLYVLATVPDAPLPFACDLARTYWRLAPLAGVRPEVAYAQAIHETGFGRYGRAVTPAHHNYCGLKVTNPAGADDNPDAHARFPTPEVGVRAHLEHLALYAGAPGMPAASPVDPRHFHFLAGTARTLEELGGRWAPSSTYGDAVRRHVDGILATPAA